jgi:hypothetical protein
MKITDTQKRIKGIFELVLLGRDYWLEYIIFQVLCSFLFFFLIGLPLSFVWSKILVYNTRLRIKGLIKWNTTLKTTSTTFHSLNLEEMCAM